MICRHSKGDPACGSTSGGYQDQANTIASLRQEVERWKKQVQASPDPTQYEIVDVEEVGPHLVVKAKFPN